MQRYFEQLIEDIQQAALRKPGQTSEAVVVNDSWIDKYPRFQFLEGKKFSEWFGLEKERFPPAERFNEEQLQQLTDILCQLYWHFNNELGISKYESNEVRYNLAVESLDKQGSFVEDSHEPIYFCERDETKCPFKSDCYCYRMMRENPCSF